MQLSPSPRPLLGLLAGTCCLAAAEGGQPTVGQAIDHALDHAGQALREVSWGAYGEGHYTNQQNTGKDDQLDLHRLVLMLESRLAEDWRLVGEIEVEHAYVKGGTKGKDDKYANGYVAVEQAWLGWRFLPQHEFKAGMLLVPISIGNLHHEPTIFHGVERSLFDNRIVPSTWHELGLSLEGDLLPGLGYAVALQGGLAGTELKPGNGFRDGRQKSAEASAEDLMATLRLDWRPDEHFWLALAANHGGLDQRHAQEAGADGVMGTLLVAEFRWQALGFEAGTSAAHGRINDPTELKAGLPETFWGVTGFIAYDLLHALALTRADRLHAFLMAERLVNNATMPAGIDPDDALNSRGWKGGLTWRPNPYVVFKADYHWLRHDDRSRADTWNLGMGFAF